MIKPGWQEFQQKAKKGNLIPVYREILADLETPVSAFLKIEDGENSFLLESVEGSELVGRYSILGTNPLFVVSCKDQKVTFQYHGKVQEGSASTDPLELIKKLLAVYKPVLDEDLPPFIGGAVGYLAYDAVRYFEKLPYTKAKDDRELPDCLFMVADTVLIFDHFKHMVLAVANAYITDKEGPREAYDKACEKIDFLVEQLKKPLKIAKAKPAKSKAISLSPDFEKQGFIEAVEKIKEHIRAGDIIQAVLSQRLQGKMMVDPFTVYRVLRTINPSPYMFYLQFGDLQLVGSSPEMLVRVKGTHVETRPIAGTRPRGRDSEEDANLMNELITDSKERAEHLMLVDLSRNDLGRVCDYGTVEVRDLMRVEKFSHVMHLVTEVHGTLKQGHDVYDCLRSCFPAGTVSGAPKIRAMEIIEELEPFYRGPYAGAVGYFGFQGNMDTCIALRTLVIHKEVAYVQAGAGIVADSHPELEYEESMNKSKALVKAISLASEGL